MDWIASILSKLPLEFISNVISQITFWWSRAVQNISPDVLPVFAYIVFSVAVLLLWLLVMRVLPKPLGGMSWMAIFAILIAPNVAAGSGGRIAPASIAAIYGLLMKDYGLALRNLLPILVVFTLGLFLGFIWQLIRGAIDASIKKSHHKADVDEEEQVQAAAENYLELVQEESVPSPVPNTAETHQIKNK